jgi:hypothetical protein
MAQANLEVLHPLLLLLVVPVGMVHLVERLYFVVHPHQAHRVEMQ